MLPSPPGAHGLSPSTFIPPFSRDCNTFHTGSLLLTVYNHCVLLVCQELFVNLQLEDPEEHGSVVPPIGTWGLLIHTQQQRWQACTLSQSLGYTSQGTLSQLEVYTLLLQYVLDCLRGIIACPLGPGCCRRLLLLLSQCLRPGLVLPFWLAFSSH